MNNNKRVVKTGSCSTSSSTSCPKIGIKIHESNNEYKTNPFSSNPNPPPNPTMKQSTKTATSAELCDANNFDLNIDNYSMKDIFNLFNIQSELLNEDVMKEAKNLF